jgi:hypothetical protein
VAVQLPHRLAAVLVAEVQRDVARVQFQDVPGVPAEVVPSGGVEVHLAKSGAAARRRSERGSSDATVTTAG